MTDGEVAAYEAPFPTEAHKAGARIFPTLVPAHPTDPASWANRCAWLSLTRFHKPFLCAFSDSDPITRGACVAWLPPPPQSFQPPSPLLLESKQAPMHGACFSVTRTLVVCECVCLCRG